MRLLAGNHTHTHTQRSEIQRRPCWLSGGHMVSVIPSVSLSCFFTLSFYPTLSPSYFISTICSFFLTILHSFFASFPFMMSLCLTLMRISRFTVVTVIIVITLHSPQSPLLSASDNPYYTLSHTHTHVRSRTHKHIERKWSLHYYNDSHECKGL